MTAYDTVTARLAERTGGTGRNGSWPCPAHDDHDPSLSVTNGDGKALLHCHAGCNVVDIVTILGLEVADLFDEQPSGSRAEIVATYDYTDEDGTLLFQVVRYFPKDFRQRRPDGVGGWVWKLGDTRRVLYRLPQVVRAIDQLETIYVVEGEKDADRLVRSGEVATCNPGGVGKWRREYTNLLSTAHVVIVADRDGPGRKHAKKIHTELTGTAASVRVVEPAVGKDVCDHFAAGHGVDDFIPVVYEPDPSVGEAEEGGGVSEDAFDDVPDEPGHVVLDAVRDWLTAHVAYQSPHHAPTVALWCLHTHDIDHAASTPRIAFESPEPES
ncbi:MAG: hypothetical protein ACRD0V_04325, partial [Acidimicrobiales bacterium]